MTLTIYDVFTNNTEQEIIGYQQGMLAYNDKGEALDIHWNILDSSMSHSYYNLYISTDINILSGQTTEPNGWSLTNFGEEEKYNNYEDIVFVLYNFKEITMEDGTIWKNPNYEEWLDTFKGEAIKISILQNYYPYINQIKFY